MKRLISVVAKRLRRLTIINTILAFGFGMITRSAWSHETIGIWQTVAYTSVATLSGITAFCVVVMSFLIPFNSHAPKKVWCTMGILSFLGAIAGLFFSILPNMIWILSTLTILAIIFFTIVIKEVSVS